MRIKHFILIALATIYGTLHGQIIGEENDPLYSAPILPPSPTASELGKYGQIPIGLFTGTPDIKIPLFTLEGKNLNLPISLSYNCNGVKVDQIASWVGMGWSLNAGGVITRVVRDEPDDLEERNMRDDFEPITEELLEYMQATFTNSSIYDTEPDLFCFNFCGFSGKFVLDNELKPVQIPHSNLIIETNNLETGELTDIVIIGPDGVKYYFGGIYTEKSKTLQSGGAMCGKNYSELVNTAWYLYKIENIYSEKILLTYSSNQYSTYTGISQTIRINYGNENVPDGCPDQFSTGTCYSLLSVLSYHLTNISSDFGGTVDFISSNDRQDMSTPGDAKLNEIIYKDSQGNVMASDSLIYTYSSASGQVHGDLEHLRKRLFLTQVITRDENKNTEMKHLLYYNNIDGLPPRLSFSQDHWGYYNGQENTIFVPHVDDWESLFGLSGVGGGNREPFDPYSKYGLLSSIIYPTGGHTDFEYEPNTVFDDVTIYPPHSIDYADINGLHEPNYESITVLNQLSQKFDIKVGVTSTEPPPGLPHDHKGQFILFDNTTSTTILNCYISFNNPNLIFKPELEENHSYTFTIYAFGDGTTTNLTIKYYTSAPMVNQTNVLSGGCRVKKVTSVASIDSEPVILRYFYNKLSNMEESSGVSCIPPVYFFNNQVQIRTPTSGSIPCLSGTCYYVTKTSNSIHPLYNYCNNTTVYEWVTVSQGENFENGGEEHQYLITEDQAGQQIAGFQMIPNALRSNNSWQSGEEKYYRIFSKSSTGEFITLTETNNFFSIDNSNNNSLFGLVGRQISPYPPCYDMNAYYLLFNFYDLIKYEIFSQWKYLSYSVTKKYDQNGLNPIVDTLQFFYENPLHCNLSKKIQPKSGHGRFIQTYKYPLDFICPESPVDPVVSGVKQLQDHNLINTVLERSNWIISPNSAESRLVNSEMIKYIPSSSGIPFASEVFQLEINEPITDFSPISIDNGTFIHDFRYVNSITLNEYDADGNILELFDRTEGYKSFKWNPNSKRLEAVVQNARNNACSYTGFEVQQTNNWNSYLDAGNSIEYNISHVHSGLSSLKVNSATGAVHDFHISSDIVGNHPGFKASVWVKGNNYAYINIEVKDNHAATFRRKYNFGSENEWHLLEIELPREVLILHQYNLWIRVYAGNDGGSAVYLDDIRFLPIDAEMVTYSFDYMGRIISRTDERNFPSYYEYDAMGRLNIIRDHLGNIVKKHNYNFKEISNY
ncbi:MAG TPA: hypothetical protein P5531_12735 [Bacteroidales bacterium]|nr:hypothetical protein [Bacteroidales bacterium]HSA44441.1 hypothetical protein [Bacteroidales bacterium]